MIRSEGVGDETELDSEALERLVQRIPRIGDATVWRRRRCPIDQLTEAAHAVYRSWESARAQEYRRLNALDGH